jgi:hypothetical protein
MSTLEEQLRAVLKQAFDGGGKPEMAHMFINGEWVLIDLKTGLPVVARQQFAPDSRRPFAD